MPKMTVLRTIHIDAKPIDIFPKINNLGEWGSWSPWMILEDGVKVEVKDNGKFQSWEGNRIGSGTMQITNEIEDKQVDIDLTFLKPYKSKAKVSLMLTEQHDGTSVAWKMESSLPFFMFWMKKAMSAFIGMDFERGLKLLKEYVEVGHVNSKLDILGKQQFEGENFIGLKGSASIDNMGEDMSQNIEKLMHYIHEKNIKPAGEVVSVYHKWDIKNRQVGYAVGVIVDSNTEVDGPFYIGKLPKSTLHTVRHTGPYDHLGNAWTLQQMMSRNKEFKADKKYFPFERYMNDPSQVSKEELITEISFGTK